MRERIIIFACLLVAGFVLNLLVCGVLSIWPLPVAPWVSTSTNPQRDWDGLHTNVPLAPSNLTTETSFVWTMIDAREPATIRGSGDSAMAHRLGVPFRCLMGVDSWTSSSATVAGGFVSRNRLFFSRTTLKPWREFTNNYLRATRWPSAIPTRPLLFGMLANTVFYAGVLCALLLPFRKLRYRLFRNPNRCPRCGYNIQALDKCPECGRERSGASRASKQNAQHLVPGVS